MGNQCGGCKSRRRAVNVFDPEDLNSELNFIERPLQRKEKVNSDDEGSSSSGESGSENGESEQEENDEEDRIRQQQDALFEEFCAKWLDLSEPEKHILEVEVEGREEKLSIITDFQYFQQVFKTAFFWKKMKFERPKSIYENVRREYLKRQDMPKYKETLKEAQDLEEACFDDVLGSLYDKLRINAKIFQDSIDYYSKDEEQEEQLGSIVKLTQDSMQVLKREFFSMEEEKAEIELTREQALQVVKTKLDITLKLLMEFREVEQDLKLEIFGDASGEEEEDVIQGKQIVFKEKLNEAIKFMNFMASDHLHNAAEVDIEQLNKNLKRLNLSEETDSEYAQLMQTYQQKVDEVNMPQI